MGLHSDKFLLPRKGRTQEEEGYKEVTFTLPAPSPTLPFGGGRQELRTSRGTAPVSRVALPRPESDGFVMK